MGFNDIHEMIQIIYDNNLGKLEIDNKMVQDRLNMICNFVLNVVTDYEEELKMLPTSSVRFCDYYDVAMCHDDGIIEYFDDNYVGHDKEKMIDVFALYVILKNAQEIVYNYSVCDNPVELYEFLDCGNYFEDLLNTINYLVNKRRIDKFYDGPEFLNPNNKYRILFTGLCLDDIRVMGKNVKKSFIKKLSGQLCKSDCITLSESIDRVKCLYDFPISRVQFANDYRIAYLRKENVTVILGVSIKSGKEKDYNRYDSVAKKKKEIYHEIELFNENCLSENSDHYKVLKNLIDFYDKEMSSDVEKVDKHSK